MRLEYATDTAARTGNQLRARPRWIRRAGRNVREEHVDAALGRFHGQRPTISSYSITPSE